MKSSEPKRIALALSGGGVRAMAFHIGVLRCLAEHQLMERVTRVSTVSGGSLLVGLLLQENEFRWPSSDRFLTHLEPRLRDMLCSRSLQWGAARQLKSPRNFKFILSRANLLALALENEWGIRSSLSELPSVPEWSINGTTAENGKRFRFKRDDIGDYTIGYANGGHFPLANALAVSAAFPGGFGPLTIDATKFAWHRRPWDSPVSTEVQVEPDHDVLHLYDGGVYDNLGLEPFFDSGRGISKHPDDAIIVSDAGAPLPSGFSFRSLHPFRLKRVADIMSDQSRALRIRTFVNFLQQAPGRGAFVSIGMPIRDDIACESAEFASSFPTTLRRLRHVEFDKIANHGYRAFNKVAATYGLAAEG